MWIALYAGNINGGRGGRFVDSHVSLNERLGLARLLCEIAIVELRTLNRASCSVYRSCCSSVCGGRKEIRLDQNNRCPESAIAEEGRRSRLLSQLFPRLSV